MPIIILVILKVWEGGGESSYGWEMPVSSLAVHSSSVYVTYYHPVHCWCYPSVISFSSNNTQSETGSPALQDGWW